MFMPQKDLLGFLKREQAQQEQGLKVQLAQSDIKRTSSTVKLAIKQLGDPELDAELAKLGEMGGGGKPEVMKREAIRKLGDLADRLRKMQSGTQAKAMASMQQMLKQLRGSSQGLSQKLRQALAKSNFSQASSLLKQLQKQLLEGELSDEKRKELSQQLQELGRKLEALAKKNDQLESELEKMGLNKKLAQLNEEQLRKALQKQGLNSEKIEQLLQKMAACRLASSRCSILGAAMAACGAGGMSGDELAAIAGQLDELDSFQQQAMLSQASLDEIERSIACLGNKNCQGSCSGGCYGPFRTGLGQQFGRGTGGPGRGFGPRDADKEGETSTKSTRVKSKTGKGPVVASWYFKGTQVKGQARRDFSEVVQAGRDSAAEAINENQIPRKYEESVKKYFGHLEESAGDSN